MERFRKIAFTMASTKISTVRLSRYPSGPSVVRAIAPIDLPPSRALTNMDVMSCMAPKKMPPITNHNQTGCQP